MTDETPPVAQAEHEAPAVPKARDSIRVPRRRLACCTLIPLAVCLAAAALAGAYALARASLMASIQSAYQTHDCEQVAGLAWSVEKLYWPQSASVAQAQIDECAVFVRASERWDQKDWDGAYRGYKDYLQAYPKGTMIAEARENAAASLYRQAEEQIKTRKYEGATESLRIIITDYDDTTSYPDCTLLLAEGYLLWGETLQQQGQYETALAKYREAIHNDPYPDSRDAPAARAKGHLAELHRSWARVLTGQEEYTEAISHLEEAARSALPDDSDEIITEIADTYLLWALYLSKSGEYLKALEKTDLASETVLTAAAGNATVANEASQTHDDILAELAVSTGKDAGYVMLEAAAGLCSNPEQFEPRYPFFGSDTASKKAYAFLVTEPVYVSSEVVAQSPSTLSYIVCLARGTAIIETCAYTGGHTIERQQTHWEVKVFDVLSGKLLRQTRIRGSAPQQCAYTEYFTVGVPKKTFMGSDPTVDKLNEWLSTFVK